MSAPDLRTARWRTSSYSTDNANCVEVAFLGTGWRKSSYSSDNANCVEVAAAADAVGVRDSKDRLGPALVFGAAAWSAFVDELKRR